ncbi:general secretion pathway protein GspC [Leptospira langatensis]|uniref:General secretion pathway protein GspC n=1 Tax=Leptospira langatensis TaxID=2484983 RepID=A0A5F2A0A3_9LEPT|nr:general secretion pathway protein GspC [Leptospira langatensis]TGK04263.1 general secretion pathway protein GspC [Leptospira langatensis]TGL43743.1 general secretion pathway protein GspC [Leptospira langatensis]
MNAIFIELRKHTFYALIPIVVFFSFSLAYLCRGILLLFLTPDVQTGSASVAPRRPVNPPMISMDSYKEMVTGNLFRGSLAPPPGEVAAGAGGPGAPGAPPDTGEGEDMRITGTLSGHWSFARVTILEKGKQYAEEFATGETIAGYKVKSILLNHVILEKGGSPLKVEIGQTPGEARAKLGAAAAAPGAPSSPDSVKKILSRQDVNRKLADPTAIYRNARFGPFLENNIIGGYKIYSISNDHIFYSLGARNGDVIRRVNGMPLNDTVKMMEIWNSLKTTDKVSVDVERGGKVLSYEFIIRN